MEIYPLPITVDDLLKFEGMVSQYFKKQKIKVPIHLSGSTDGKYEKWLVKLFKKIKKTDYVFSTHRNHYHYILKTGDRGKLLLELFGSEDGICKGMSGSMHTIDHKNRFYSSGIVAGCVSIAVGVAYGLKLLGKDESHVWCFVGDGATDSGLFFEALRYADGHNLPITFIVEDNNRSVCTDKKTRWGSATWPVLQGKRLKVIKYKPRYPHAGIGEFVAF